MADALAAIASPTRLALLRELRTPKVLSEIQVTSEDRGEGPHIARQNVRKHLDRLIEARLVSTRDVERDGRDTVEYVVDHQAVFSLADDVRALARLRPIIETFAETSPSARSDLALGRGPALIVARGLEDGHSFSLKPSEARTAWVLGRRRDVEIPLDFDRSVSSQHARIIWTGNAHTITDAGSRNGTLVNFRALAVGEQRPLRHGDLIGIGRCLLVYWG